MNKITGVTVSWLSFAITFTKELKDFNICELHVSLAPDVHARGSFIHIQDLEGELSFDIFFARFFYGLWLSLTKKN